MSSDFLYVQRKYRHCRIEPERELARERWTGEDWWNGVSLPIGRSIQHKCSKCQRDTQLFYRLRKEGKDISKFEDGYKSWMKGKALIKVECTLNCFWYDYFQQVRGIQSSDDNHK